MSKGAEGWEGKIHRRRFLVFDSGGCPSGCGAGLKLKTLERPRRDPYFRDRIIQAYEHQCALCGFDLFPRPIMFFKRICREIPLRGQCRMLRKSLLDAPIVSFQLEKGELMALRNE